MSPKGLFKNSMSRLVNYIKSSIEELRKVAWPTRKQAVDSTLIVLGITLVSTVIITLLDVAFRFGYQYASTFLAGPGL